MRKPAFAFLTISILLISGCASGPKRPAPLKKARRHGKSVVSTPSEERRTVDCFNVL